MQINQSIYGPYEFYKKKNRILFMNVERNKKYQLLYELNSKEFYAPNLFSSNADTYDYLTSLLDSNASLDVGDKRFPCFKYLQAFSDRPKLYRVIFIDKKTFLPIRINYYDDKDQKILTKEIFLLN